MKRIVIFLFIVFSLQTAYSQDFELIRHQVKMGETVRMLSKKYKVEPAEIYKLNKFAIDGISQGMVLQILVPKKELPVVDTTEQPIADNTQTTTADNPDETVNTTTTTTKKVTTVRKKKQVDEPADNTTTTPEEPSVTTSMSTESSSMTATHTVAKGETLFSIARRYNVSVEDIKAQNASLEKKGLQRGQVLNIVSKSSETVVEKVPDNVAVDSPTLAENTVPSDGSGNNEVRHTVAKGETLFSLSRKYNIPVETIKMHNEQALKKGLQIGQVLVISK